MGRTDKVTKDAGSMKSSPFSIIWNEQLGDVEQYADDLISGSIAIATFTEAFRYRFDTSFRSIMHKLDKIEKCEELNSIPLSTGFPSGMMTSKNSFYRQYFNVK